MEVRNRETGEVIRLSEFLAAHSSTSFPRKITEEILDSYGYDQVFEGPNAEYTAPYGASVRDGVVQIGDQWYTKYVAGPIFANEADEAAYKQTIDDQVSANQRRLRDELLAKSDWTVLADSPLTTAKKTEWKTYRAALRDISAAEGFPHTMEWPTEPS